MLKRRFSILIIIIYKDANISEGATTYAIVQQINPLEKIVELYERLLKSEQDKIEILKKYMK